MNKAILVGIIILILSKAELKARTDLRDGFIITASKDTIFGKIEFRSDSNNERTCIFSTGSGKMEYSPSQILGYGFLNDRYYSSQIIDGKFVEVLVTGELSLYESDYTFYIQKTGTELYILEAKQIRDTAEIKVTGGSDKVVGYRQDLKWLGTISFLTSDCLESHNELQSLTLNVKSLTRFVVNYNLCRGGGFKYYKVSKPRYRIDYGISVAMVSSTLQFKNLPSQFIYLNNRYQTYDVAPGLLFAVSSPRISENLALQTELCYVRTSYYSQNVVAEPSMTNYYETYIDFSTISIPVSLRYTIPVGNSSLFFNAGAEFAFLTDNNSYVNTEMLSGSIVDTYVNDVFEFNNSPLGYWGDIGYLKSFKSFRIGATLKYYHSGNTTSSEEFTSSLNKISLSIILLCK